VEKYHNPLGSRRRMQ